MSEKVITEWQPHYAKLFGRHTLRLKHNLNKSELFSDDALADLLENMDRSDFHVNTMAYRNDGSAIRREGDFGDMSGKQLLKAARNGNIWINIRAPQNANPAYGRLLDNIYKDFEARVPGLETFKHIITILISSPNVTVPYHCDVPGQMLWQVRGKKRVWIYPASEPYVSQAAIEKLILGELHETDMAYEPWFDEGAQVYDLEPGYMAHWPLNCPHRVENHNCLNVSVTTEHYTRQIRRSYAVNYSNGLLRKFGVDKPQRQQVGPGVIAKMAMAAVTKYSGIRRAVQKPYLVDFSVDVNAPNGIRDISPYKKTV